MFITCCGLYQRRPVVLATRRMPRYLLCPRVYHGNDFDDRKGGREISLLQRETDHLRLWQPELFAEKEFSWG